MDDQAQNQEGNEVKPAESPHVQEQNPVPEAPAAEQEPTSQEPAANPTPPPSQPEQTPPASGDPTKIGVVKRESQFKPAVLIITAVMLLIAAGLGLYFVMSQKPEPEAAPVATQPAEQTPTAEMTLTVTSPTADSAATGKMLTVTGVTAPNIPVVLMTEDHDNTVMSGETGAFEGEIELEGGINTLTVTAMGEDGQEKTQSLEIVWDDQVLGKKTDDSSPGNSANSQGKKPIKNDVQSISKLVQVDDQTEYVDEKNKPIKSTTVKATDKAFAIIESENGGNGTVQNRAVKIFVNTATISAQVRMAKRRAVQGVITGVEDGKIILAHQVQRDRQYTVYFDDQTMVVALGTDSPVPGQLEAGQRVVAVGDLNDTGDIMATRITVIPGKATGIFDKQPVTPFATPTPEPTPESTITSTPSATPTETVEPTPSVTPVPDTE